MAELKVFYEGNLSTKCVHLESGCEVKTQISQLSPTELFAASLGSCVLTVMALAAEKMGIDFSGAKVHILKEMSRTLPRRVGSLILHFTSPALLNDEICSKLEKIAEDCPIHHSLHPDIHVEFYFKWGVF